MFHNALCCRFCMFLCYVVLHLRCSKHYLMNFYTNHTSFRPFLQNLFTLFETYRLHLVGIASTTSDTNVTKTFNKLIGETKELQNELWCKAEHLQRLISQAERLNKHCDDLTSSLTHLHSDYTANKVSKLSITRLIKSNLEKFCST